MKRLTYISLLLVFLTGLASCLREEAPAVDVERTNDLPIELEVTIGDALDNGASTRSVERAKRTFTSGDPENGIPADIIHLQSTFELTEGDSLTRYCAMQYTDEGTWQPMGNASFAWPNNAVKGTFTAYYIYGSTGALTDNVSSNENSATQVLFTSIVDGQDPLRADIKDVRYGHTVQLQFKHILTHLTLIELDAGIDDYLIFRVDTVSARNENKHQFNNAFKISLDKGADGDQSPEIKFEYTNVPESATLGSYIKSPTEVVRDKVTRLESGQVGFFLEPGYAYNAFQIHYSNNDLYLTYTNSDPGNKNHTLEENNRYTFNVKKSAGITMTTPPEQRWDESEDITTVVNAEAFLHAVTTNSDYSEFDEKKGEYVQILEATTNPVGTLLKCNVRFQNPYYHVFPHYNPEDGASPYDFVPSVGADNVFDGGYHYIKGLCCPLFFENHGVIKNLGLADVKIGDMDTDKMWESSKNYKRQTGDQADYVKAPYEYLRTGAVATNNFGTVQNMRIKNLTVNVGIHVTENNQEAHNVGGLFGVNNSGGYVEKIYLSGKIEVTVQNFTGIDIVPEVNIGGLAGQNLGTMIEIEQLVDNRDGLPDDEKPKPVTIVVNNKLKGTSGAYYIGGLVGNNTGKLSEVSLPTTKTQGYAITVDSSMSSGVLSDIGGIAGKADSSQGNEISSCLIGSGNVKAGSTARFQAIDPYSYTGGIVGVLSERTHVFNCTSFCSVYGFNGNSSDGVTKASGGAFGNIKAIIQSEGSNISAGTMTAIAAFGEQLSGANAGCFVGEAPHGKEWKDYEDSADVKKFDNINYIGTNTAQ